MTFRRHCIDEMTGERAGSAKSRGTCRYLKVAFWHSDAWHAIGAAGHGRLLYLHLLTGPHTLSYHVPGLYHVGKEALKEAMGLRPREYKRAVAQVLEKVGMQMDARKGLIWLPSAITHLGPPANPNIVRGYCRALGAMPHSPLIAEAVTAYLPFLLSLGRAFWEPLATAFPGLCSTDGLPPQQSPESSLAPNSGASQASKQSRQPEDDGPASRDLALTSLKAIFEQLS